jgi:hypothetical protein
MVAGLLPWMLIDGGVVVPEIIRGIGSGLRRRDSSLQFELQPQLAADGFNVGLCLLEVGLCHLSSVILL